MRFVVVRPGRIGAGVGWMVFMVSVLDETMVPAGRRAPTVCGIHSRQHLAYKIGNC